MMFENARADSYGASVIRQVRMAPGLYVTEMRGSVGLRPQPQVKKIDASEFGDALHVACQFTDDIADLGLHRREALHSLEEFLSKQPFKIANKAEPVVHPHRSESILRKNMQPSEKVV